MNLYLEAERAREMAQPKALPAWVLDQPAGFFIARYSGKYLTLNAYNFAKGSNWTVIVDGVKVGKLRITNKGMTAKTFRLQHAASVCLKNQITDLKLCVKPYFLSPYALLSALEPAWAPFDGAVAAPVCQDSTGCTPGVRR